MAFLSPEEQLERIRHASVDLVSEEELLKKLKKSFEKNQPLRIKLGMDPSRPDLHLGHYVVLNKMRIFQELGHHIIFLIGDFTAMIGDPTGKNETRPALSKEEVVENSKTYAKQVFKILDPEKTEIAYNSTWMEKFNATDFIKLAGHYTVARMIERDDFTKRFSNNQPISLHEFLYPLVQGYDSVALKSDIELGGSDQRFNLLVGRDLQKAYGQEPQCILTMPILEGLDGVQKMSKSLDNYIGLEDTPKDMFGKSMRVSDELMIRYYELLTDFTQDDLEKLKSDLASGALHPRNAKVNLAKLIVARFYDQSTADAAEAEFNEIFVNKGLPDEIPESKMEARSESIPLPNLLSELGMTASNGEARRLIKGGGVKIDGEKVDDEKYSMELSSGLDVVIRAGKKKFLRLIVE
ncbi:MAG: tyrosine--tRNA ligase [Bdellovibrionaceae bacterium]|nr:tyrosine--tRNA ligase [Pseudobdellovibrionaceae bacterium]|tara:strand:- start:34370 stop:35596 length:1227 start_codon:yes stop_codon:yes gene_type:complete